MYNYTYFDHNWLIKKINNRCLQKSIPQMTGTIIDLGCGTSPFKNDFNFPRQNYLGIDWAESIHMTDAQIIANLTKNFPIDDSCADVVLSLHVLEHIPNPREYLQESFRILKNNGQVFILTPFQWWEHEPPHDYYRFTRYGLNYLLVEAGFSEIKISEVGGFWCMVSQKINYQLYKYSNNKYFYGKCLRALFIPFWILSQTMAIILDSFWTEKRESCGYFTIARKNASDI